MLFHHCHELNDIINGTDASQRLLSSVILFICGDILSVQSDVSLISDPTHTYTTDSTVCKVHVHRLILLSTLWKANCLL